MFCFLLCMHDWLIAWKMHGDQAGAVVFFDLTKAFNSVPHTGIHIYNGQVLCRLRAIGLNDYLVSWISNYLTKFNTWS